MNARPNIIFIVADDLGCYGGREAEFGPVSPQLDKLAADGLRFTDGYSNSPICSPTRFALMTARYQYRLRGAAQEPINSRSKGSTTLGLAPHPALAAQGRGLPHRADRKMASGLSAQLQPAQVGLRGILRADVGWRGLLQPRQQQRHARSVFRRGGEDRGRLSDRPHLAALGGLHRAHGRGREERRALLPEHALHRAALALGNARRHASG